MRTSCIMDEVKARMLIVGAIKHAGGTGGPARPFALV